MWPTISVIKEKYLQFFYFDSCDFAPELNIINSGILVSIFEIQTWMCRLVLVRLNLLYFYINTTIQRYNYYTIARICDIFLIDFDMVHWYSYLISTDILFKLKTDHIKLYDLHAYCKTELEKFIQMGFTITSCYWHSYQIADVISSNWGVDSQYIWKNDLQ
jgi:hypothetical protein